MDSTRTRRSLLLVSLLVCVSMVHVLWSIKMNHRPNYQTFYGFAFLLCSVIRKLITNLCGVVQPGVADPVVVHFELVDAPHVGHLEDRLVGAAGLPLERSADERVDAHELQLDVGRFKRLPFPVLELFNLDSVDLEMMGFIISAQRELITSN